MNYSKVSVKNTNEIKRLIFKKEQKHKNEGDGNKKTKNVKPNQTNIKGNKNEQIESVKNQNL